MSRRSGMYDEAGARRHEQRYRERHWANGPARSRRLRRDSERRWIGGVCAGIGNYYGCEPWLVRCIAATGLIFMTSLTFVAYWVLFFFVMNPSRGKRRHERRHGAGGGGSHAPEAPELGVRVSPRRSLRNLQADLMQAELRLRRIEAQVTSDRYELHREFNKMDGAADRS